MFETLSIGHRGVKIFMQSLWSECQNLIEKFQANLKIQTLCGLKFHEIDNSNKEKNSHEVGCRDGQYLQA